MESKESTRVDFRSKTAGYLQRGFHPNSIEEKLDEINVTLPDDKKLAYCDIADIVASEIELYEASKEIENAKQLQANQKPGLMKELWDRAQEKRRDLISRGLLIGEESEEVDEFTSDVPIEWVDQPEDAAYQGVLGEIVKAIVPLTEADPVGILASLLVGMGNLFGPGPFVRVGQVRQPARLSMCLVGSSSKARKGTATAESQAVLDMIEPAEATSWFRACVMRGGGLVSGEGLVEAVRDGYFVVKKGKKEPEFVEGVADKRLYVIETEFGRVLQVMCREGSVLGAVLCQAWDSGGDLSSLSRRQLIATGAHISITGHITIAEVKDKLKNTEIHNGFGNRILWVIVRRQRILPFGSDTHLIDWSAMGVLTKLRRALELSRKTREVAPTEEAKKYWEVAYDDLSRERHGVAGELCHRFEAQGLRLALIYCLLEGRARLEKHHLEGAYEFLKYCERSVLKIWGDRVGNYVADEMSKLIKQAGPGGIARTDLRNVCAPGRKKSEIDLALNLLLLTRYFWKELVSTGGKQREMWFYDPKRKASK